MSEKLKFSIGEYNLKKLNNKELELLKAYMEHPIKDISQKKIFMNPNTLIDDIGFNNFIQRIKAGTAFFIDKKQISKSELKKEKEQILKELTTYFEELKKLNSRNDHHGILGIKEGLSKEEIQKAYWGLMQKYHSDKFKQYGDQNIIDMADEILKIIINAYKLLTDPEGYKAEQRGEPPRPDIDFARSEILKEFRRRFGAEYTPFIHRQRHGLFDFPEINMDHRMKIDSLTYEYQVLYRSGYNPFSDPIHVALQDEFNRRHKYYYSFLFASPWDRRDFERLVVEHKQVRDMGFESFNDSKYQAVRKEYMRRYWVHSMSGMDERTTQKFYEILAEYNNYSGKKSNPFKDLLYKFKLPFYRVRRKIIGVALLALSVLIFIAYLLIATSWGVWIVIGMAALAACGLVPYMIIKDVIVAKKTRKKKK